MNNLVFINNTTTVDSGSAGVTNPSQVVDQQVAIFDADNLSGGTLDLTGANATERMIVVQGDDKHPFVSQVIKKSDVSRVITKPYQAYVNQVTHVGFNGVDSEIIATPGEGYVKIVRLDKGFEQFPRSTANVKVVATDTQYAIAHKIASEFNTKRGSKAFVDADVLVNQASTQLVDTAGVPANITLSAIKGSNIVIATVTSAAEVDASVGDYLRIGSATALTSPVYQIKAIETNSGSQTLLQITLDRAYSGDTATTIAAGTLSATITTQEAGVKLTAKDLDEVLDFVESTSAVSFSTSLSPNFEGTIVAVSVTPKTGSGTFAQVLGLEHKFSGIKNSFYHRNYLPQTPEYYADESTNYDICTVVMKIDNDKAVVPANEYLGFVFCFATGASLSTQLETFFGVS